MANAFVLNRPFVTSSIFGVTSLFQLKENLECLKINLSKNLLNDLNAVHISDPNPCV